jgi:hypothetical protein
LAQWTQPLAADVESEECSGNLDTLDTISGWGAFCLSGRLGLFCSKRGFGLFCSKNEFGLFCSKNEFGLFCSKNEFGLFCSNELPNSLDDRDLISCIWLSRFRI